MSIKQVLYKNLFPRVDQCWLVLTGVEQCWLVDKSSRAIFALASIVGCATTQRVCLESNQTCWKFKPQFLWSLANPHTIFRLKGKLNRFPKIEVRCFQNSLRCSKIFCLDSPRACQIQKYADFKNALVSQIFRRISTWAGQFRSKIITLGWQSLHRCWSTSYLVDSQFVGHIIPHLVVKR